jgi:hypothetical protein
VVFGLDGDNRQYVATHGKSKLDAQYAADMGNNLKKVLNWPPEKCNTKPLERVCKNCGFWQEKRIDHSERIPENWPGSCMFNPDPTNRREKDIACGNFEPKY